MAEQTYSSAPSRDLGTGAGINSKINVPPAHPSTVTGGTAGNQGNGDTPGSQIKGFSGDGFIKAFIK